MSISETIDHLVGIFSPRRALLRAQARQALAFSHKKTRSYQGARVQSKWSFLFGSDANTLVGPALTPLRERARDLVRNTPYGERIVDVLSTNLIGTGIVPVSRTGIEALDRKVNRLFSAWSDQCLVSGELDFYGAQVLVCRSMIEGGEALVRFLPRSPDQGGLAVPLQLQLMEGDHLEERSSSETVLGVAFDLEGRRTGYWIRPSLSGDRLPSQAVFLSAKDVCHVYRPLRIGQVRGVSWFAPVLLTMRDLADYLEASLVKGRTEACFAAFIKSLDPGMPGNLASLQRASAPQGERGDLELSPGLITRLDPGEDVSFAQPSSSHSFEPYVLQAAMAIAVGTGITYDQLTGDLRQANYSSLRAGKIEFRGLIRQLQYHLLIRMFCKPVWDRFTEAAVLSGALPPRKDGYPVNWIAPGFEPIDPLKDLKADILAVRSGRSTWAEFVAEWGNDPETQLQEIQKFNQKMDALGIALDCDPRHHISPSQGP